MTEFALTVSHLHKSYAGTPVVRDLSLEIAQGEIFGLLGPNGAGKSTTINIVAGVTRADEGQVRIFGHDNRSEYRLTRRLTGVMHQEIVIDNFFTIDEALKIHSGYYGVADDPAWRRVLIERLGLGPHLKKSMNKLSGGLKRRFMVAKALIHKPRLLILDEPTAGVDVELRRSLWEFVREINRQGTTVLLTTHYLEEAEAMCERIAILNHGRLIALEQTSALLARLDGRRVVLHLERDPRPLGEDLRALGAQWDAGSATLTLPLAPGMAATDLLLRLQRYRLPVRDLELKRAGLEEVFLELTGMANDSHGGLAP
ncbi:ABC-2 type transport system ATP-binding protein [Geoalkalibacter ferrihydriticus]|uniref:ABC transporter ATP-binding protein n=2 Tax=Geoalkalibacter ferrihydriticus TaxID=392333 RepID=A0A0C2EHW3_9BACT|nr:ABC transporter ATP-binding protein [Geoalkalibacter ferrihydriticus]KIH78233.1 ABC transporter ATP-binding protein [Geoalkalibacter ferrihydriticus DSM 17813]SDL81327.1 ABC-2 type transport system ATP-binding protein [Geoalkalibacter ferrihydriticus]